MDAAAVASLGMVAGGAFAGGFALMRPAGRAGVAPATSHSREGAIERMLAEASAQLMAWGPVRDMHERQEADRVRMACVKQMPTLIDVVTLGLLAGLSFDASLELYCERYDDELSRAFRKALLSWRIGATTRASALDAMAAELNVDALASFASTVTQALEFGMPLAESLEGQAESLRELQRSQVEEEIEKVPVKMLVPLGTLIVPAMLLAILGPLVGSALSIG